jgi:hypothetical protein
MSMVKRHAAAADVVRGRQVNAVRASVERQLGPVVRRPTAGRRSEGNAFRRASSDPSMETPTSAEAFVVARLQECRASQNAILIISWQGLSVPALRRRLPDAGSSRAAPGGAIR